MHLSPSSRSTHRQHQPYYPQKRSKRQLEREHHWIVHVKAQATVSSLFQYWSDTYIDKPTHFMQIISRLGPITCMPVPHCSTRIDPYLPKTLAYHVGELRNCRRNIGQVKDWTSEKRKQEAKGVYIRSACSLLCLNKKKVSG